MGITAASASARSKSNDTDEQSVRLLEVSRKIYPRAVSGIYARWRWIMVWVTQLVYYGLPWLTWNGREAVLFDLSARKFYIFSLVLYPQDFIYLTGLLLICAVALFLFSAVAGRLWCGYSCPQTVYTEIFLWVERVVEGDRNKRLKLDSSGSAWDLFSRKSIKHFLWILIALWTSITFVGYFTPISDLVANIVALSPGPWQVFWILFYGFATYGNAGFMREQVCKYMCPYARFQGVMVDPDTLVITYDKLRGEPRGSRSRKVEKKTRKLGDCVDCGLCVQVCPVGIDIRDGQQYECIGCAACIDVCDQVMEKMDYPKGLVRYNTLKCDAQRTEYRWRKLLFRPRVIIYATILLISTTLVFTGLSQRINFKVDVMRDRTMLSREISEAIIENVYRVMIINSAEIDRLFDLSVAGMEGLSIDSARQIEVPAASHRLIPVRVRVDRNHGSNGSNEIALIVHATDDTTTVRREKAMFYIPPGK